MFAPFANSLLPSICLLFLFTSFVPFSLSDGGILPPTPGSFAFGVEYVVQGLADAYAETGFITAKPHPGDATWGDHEPNESQPGVYDFSFTDRLVREYQRAGFRNFQLILCAQSNWGNIGPQHQVPRPEYEERYVAWVTAVVDRYKMDGNSPMPGLNFTIFEWGIEKELSGYWLGTAVEYINMLQLAHGAIKATNPQSKILLNAFILSYVFQDNPSVSVANERLQAPNVPGLGSHDLATVHSLLDAVEYYDVIDFHFLASYYEIEGSVNWIREELEKRSVWKEVYGGDVFPMSPLYSFGGPGIECEENILQGEHVFPITSETRCEASRILQAMKNLNSTDPERQRAQFWFEKNVAMGLVRKFVVAAQLGLSGLNMGNQEDWPTALWFFGASWFGWMDTSLEWITRIPGERRPAFGAAQLVARHLSGFLSVERLRGVGQNDTHDHVYLFRLPNDRSVIVTWLDELVFYGIDDIAPSEVFSIPLQRGVLGNTVFVQAMPTDRSLVSPTTTVKVKGRVLEVEVGEVPIFVYSGDSGASGIAAIVGSLVGVTALLLLIGGIVVVVAVVAIRTKKKTGLGEVAETGMPEVHLDDVLGKENE